MSDIAIKAENLGKKYLIGHQAEQERYTALRDVVGRTVKGLARSARDMIHGRPIVAGDEKEEFWALKDVNFEIKRGEVVGIIGRNGAGKSTLLKVLSRITEPSEGKVSIKGRVASLLEVGTGFHPELSGRENIYLNGAILGMTRAEIRQKFDEIVAFAEVEKFLDTPVKRYSSGMYVRLAFAVAAHLDPEILVVDEVLAVGDIAFQKKCLGKMQDVAAHGRTVLFVSHNLSTIAGLTEYSIWIDAGCIKYFGPTTDALARYRNLNMVSLSGSDSEKSPDKNYKIWLDAFGVSDGYLSSELRVVPPRTLVGNENSVVRVLIRDGDVPIAIATVGGFGESANAWKDKGKLSIRVDISHIASGNYEIEFEIRQPGYGPISNTVYLSDIDVVVPPLHGHTHGLMKESKIGYFNLNTTWNYTKEN